jgi:protein involved in ribonucleotide reduction
MSMSRADLIEYLCSQQHAARLLSLVTSGQTMNGQPFASLRATDKAAERAGVTVVLEELESLGLLREKTPAT